MKAKKLNTIWEEENAFNPVKSKFKLSTIFILLAGGLIMFLISGNFIYHSLQTEYPQLVGISVGALFGLIGVYTMLHFRKINELIVDNEKLVVKSVFRYTKRTIYLADIVSYCEIENANKYQKWFELILFTEGGSYKINSSSITNYGQFKTILTKGKTKDVNYEKRTDYKMINYISIIFIVLGLLFLFGSINVLTSENEDISPQQLSTLKLTIAQKAKFYRKKRSQEVRIVCKEFPVFSFFVAGNSFDALKSQQLRLFIKEGNTVEIDILKEDYEKKLIKSKPLTFLDKTINYNTIGLYGIRDSEHVYLALDAINQVNSKDSESWLGIVFIIFFGIVGLVIASLGVYAMLNNRT